jgi:hypothetical protein
LYIVTPLRKTLQDIFAKDINLYFKKLLI